MNSKGYSSYSEFIKENGRAGEGYEWHHIVEQRSSNIEHFGPERIHNKDNVIRLPKDIHRKISGYYSSKPVELQGLTVRKWLDGKSFDFQYEYGRAILQKYGY